MFGQAYDFAEAHNLTFVGGTDRTVGAAGGWVQVGTSSALGPWHAIYLYGIYREVDIHCSLRP